MTAIAHGRAWSACMTESEMLEIVRNRVSRRDGMFIASAGEVVTLEEKQDA